MTKCCKRLPVLLVAFCCAGLVMAQSQPPAPAPGKPAQENQYKAAPGKNKTESKQQATAPDSSSVDKGRSTLATARPKDERNNRSKEPPRDWWAIVASVLNLIFTACLVVLMHRQWRAMQEQARHMKEGLTETQKAADAATAGAAAAKVSAEAAKASAEATEESNRIAERSMKLGRRSWLVPSTFVAPKTFAPDRPWEVHIEIVNCGGIPATNVVSRFSVVLLTVPEPLPEEIEFEGNGPIGVITIAPGKAQATGAGQSLILPKSTLDNIMTGRVALYISLRLDYRDGLLDSSEPSRWSSGCWRFYPERNNWATSEKHNNAP
jgi:hypothetical protein